MSENRDAEGMKALDAELEAAGDRPAKRSHNVEGLFALLGQVK